MTDDKPLVCIMRDLVQAVSDKILCKLKDANCDVKCTDILYRYGSWVEIANMLDEWEKSATQRTEKFPLVYLIEDFDIVNGSSNDYNEAILNIFIIMNSEESYDSFTRQYKVVDTVLQPIYDELLNQMQTCGYFVANRNSLRALPHTKRVLKKLDRDRLKLNEWADAIKIQNLKLQLLKNVQ